MVDVGKTIPSTYISELTLTLEHIELIDEGRMRWHYSFFNQSDKNSEIFFDLKQTYIADEFGNRYSVLESDQNQRIPIERGTKQEYWFEFEGPQNNARKFTVGFVTAAILPASFPVFDVTLPLPSNIIIPSSPPVEPTSIPALLRVIAIGQTFPSEQKDFTVTVDKIEISEDGRMRWHLSFFNQSQSDTDLFFKLLT